MKLSKTKIDSILKSKGLNRNKIKELVGVSDGTLSKMVLGTRPFSVNVKEKLIPILEVSRDEFDSWIVADEYSNELIEKAISSISSANSPDKIFEQNINGLLAEKSLSQTDFAKIIKYDQSSVNKMINGKISLSPKVLKGLSEALGITIENIQAWCLADKYSLKTLEMALKNK